MSMDGIIEKKMAMEEEEALPLNMLSVRKIF